MSERKAQARTAMLCFGEHTSPPPPENPPVTHPFRQAALGKARRAVRHRLSVLEPGGGARRAAGPVCSAAGMADCCLRACKRARDDADALGMVAASLSAAACDAVPGRKRVALAREGLRAAEWALGAHLRGHETLPDAAVAGLVLWSKLCTRYDSALHSLIAGPDASCEGVAGTRMAEVMASAHACVGGAAVLEAVRAGQLRFRIETRLAGGEAAAAAAVLGAEEAQAIDGDSANAARASLGVVPDCSSRGADPGDDGVLPSTEAAASLGEEDALRPLRRAREVIRRSPQQLLAARSPTLLGLASSSIRVTRVRVPGWGSSAPALRGKPARRGGRSKARAAASGAE